LTKTTPVEDFNLYRIRSGNRLFVIYEGSNPRSGEATVGHFRANGLDWDLLRATDHVGARTHRGPWPDYVVVTTACPAAEQCPIEEFIGNIRR
jgi:hypothetical protein